MKRYAILFGISILTALYAIDQYDNGAYKFSHKTHVVEEEIECADCHSNVENSITGKDNLMPSRESCLDCHEADEIVNFELLPVVEKYSEKFSHQQHIAADENCESCHSEVIQKEIAMPYILPDMLDCMGCHQQKAVDIRCTTCHLPTDNLLPVSHTPAFTHNHSDLAQNGVISISANMDCATCHTKQFCQDCHEGDNLDRFVHPLNYEVTHALEAQAKQAECAVCHTERQFCIECHAENNVLPHNHTVGWVNNFPNDGGRHRVEALNDLDACIACHEQNAELICATCHGR